MAAQIDFVPRWVRVFVGVLALLNIGYGIAGYFDVTLLFHNAVGIDVHSEPIKYAAYEFAARNLAIGLGFGVVSLFGASKSIAIVTIIRALIELQTIILMLTHGEINAMLLVPIVFLAVEIFLVKTISGVIKKEEQA